jgi:hypothetical protein
MIAKQPASYILSKLHLFEAQVITDGNTAMHQPSCQTAAALPAAAALVRGRSGVVGVSAAQLFTYH